MDIYVWELLQYMAVFPGQLEWRAQEVEVSKTAIHARDEVEEDFVRIEGGR